MLSIVASDWYHGYGTIPKADGTPYSTAKGAFRNHPCTQWAAETIHNAYWLIKHGMNLCDEYHLRYGKQHSCYNTLVHAYYIFPKGKITEVTPFVRAMPDEYKLDTSIDTFTTVIIQHQLLVLLNPKLLIYTNSHLVLIVQQQSISVRQQLI